MSYEINVSLNNRHLFATHQRSLTTAQDLIRVCGVFQAKFPESEGFGISVSFDPQIKYGADISQLEQAVADNDKHAIHKLFER